MSLTLFPLEGPWQLTTTVAYCREQLDLDRDYRLFGQIVDLSSSYGKHDSRIPKKPTIQTLPLPPQLWVDICRGSETKRTREDGADNQLTFAYAEQLRKLEMPQDSTTPKNLAIKAFLEALPNDTPIILWWW